MPNEASAKKKRIILSTHRKNPPSHHPPKDTVEATHNEAKELKEDRMDQSMIFNYASVNNSLEIFDEDPKFRHFQFYQNEEDRSEPFQSKVKSRVELLQTVPSTAHMHKHNKIQHNTSSCQQPSKIATNVSLSSFHVPFQNSKKLSTCPSRRFIDLTLKKDQKTLSHQSSDSLLQGRDKNCMTRSSIFDTGRSILQSVSVNSVQFALGRVPSERKKALTITCHKYDAEQTKKKRKGSMSKCNSIKLFGKFI